MPISNVAVQILPELFGKNNWQQIYIYIYIYNIYIYTIYTLLQVLYAYIYIQNFQTSNDIFF